MISGVLIGKEHLSPFLRDIPRRVEEGLKVEIEKLSISLLRKIKQEKLSGSVLKNKTGTLRASINYRIETGPHSIKGIVGTNKEYAAIHEYGFNGVVTVRDHLRMMTKAFGQSIKNPHKIEVRAHSRQVNLPARSFLRSSIKEMDAEIKAKLKEALKRLARG